MFPTPGRGLERLTQESGATFPKSELGAKPDSGQLDLRSKGHGGGIWTSRDKIGANKKTESKLSGKSTGCISSDPLQGESQGNLHVYWEERQPSCSLGSVVSMQSQDGDQNPHFPEPIHQPSWPILFSVTLLLWGTHHWYLLQEWILTVLEDEMVGWHHWFNELELGQTTGDDEWQASLVSCSPWGHEESDMIWWLNNSMSRSHPWNQQLLGMELLQIKGIADGSGMKRGKITECKEAVSE